MTASEPTAAPLSPRKPGARLVRGLIGAVVGYGTVSLLFRVAGPGLPDPVAPDAIVAMGVACVYLTMGLFVGLGTLLPKAGARVLNVADAEELRDERKLLTMSALCSILAGAGLLVLALAGRGGGALSPQLALAITAATLLLSTILYWWGGRNQDEYRRLINAEAAQAAFYLLFFLFGGWAVLAQLGFAAMFTPLAFLSGMMGLVILAGFWIIIRRG